MEERIIELEKKVAHQEQEIRNLSNALILQHKELEALAKSMDLLKEKIAREPLVKDITDEEPPPHY